MDKKQSGDIYFKYMLLLLVVAAILRIYNVWMNSLWLDEVSTYIFSKDGFVTAFNYSLNGEFNPPLYYWVTYIFLAIGSVISMASQEFILRAPAAIFGILSVPAMYYLAHELFDKRIAILSALFTTFSGFLIYYSQEARVYTMSMFLYICLLYIYIKSYKTGKSTYWLGTGLIASLCLWSHFYMAVGIMCIAIHYIVMCFIDKKFDKQSIVAVLTFIVASSPVFLILNNLFSVRVSSDVTWGFDGFTLIVDFIYLNCGMNFIAMLIIFVIAMIGIKNICSKSDIFNTTLITIPIFITFAASYYISSVIDMNPRYLLFILPLIIMTIASFDLSLRNKKHAESLYVMLVVFFIVINIPFLTTYYASPTKTDYNEICSYLGSTDFDKLIIMPQSEGKVLGYYYDGEYDYANNLTELKDKISNNTLVMAYAGLTFGSNAKNNDVLVWLDEEAMFTTKVTNVKFYKYEG